MKRILVVSVAAMIVAGSVAAYGRELNRRVHPKGAQNVVDGTGETLDFQLTAEGAEDGSVLVKVVIPSGSELQKTSYLRLEIVKDGQILLWSKLATRKGKDGAMRTGFQIHDSLAKHAFVGFAYDAGAKGPRDGDLPGARGRIHHRPRGGAEQGRGSVCSVSTLAFSAHFARRSARSSRGFP